MLTENETRTLIEFINKSFGLDVSENLKPIALAELNKFKKFIEAIPSMKSDAKAVLNGFFGDRLEEADSTTATPMTLLTRDTNGELYEFFEPPKAAKKNICFLVLFHAKIFLHLRGIAKKIV